MKSPRKLLAGIAALALLDIEEEYDAKRWEVILQNYHDDPNPNPSWRVLNPLLRKCVWWILDMGKQRTSKLLYSSLIERIDDDDDQPTLSAQALEALREFLGEQNRASVADDEAAAAGNEVTSSSEVALLAEDWRLSQFWYDPDTAKTVAREVLSLCGSVESPFVACIACPTLYVYLKVSQWMSDKKKFQLSFNDIAVQLDLISKVHGTKLAENYFNNIPEKSKGVEAYGVLLNCYARDKSVEKAEAIMQKMRELGQTTFTFNVMLNLYRLVEKHDKIDLLVHEMEEKGIKYDKFTFSILFNTYADLSDTIGMDRIVQRMEYYPNMVLDWIAYSIAAKEFIKAGLTKKALEMLKKSEGLILASKRRSMAYEFLLTQYAAIGEKDEVLRLWELHKKTEKIYNKSYISMITSLLKLDDIEEAEKIFEEWDSSELFYDFQVPNFLIGAYCRKGLMEKAETLINRARMKRGKPLAQTWYYLASGYVNVNEMPKAIEALKVAVSAFRPGWKPSGPILVACLEYLKEKGDVEEAKEFLGLLLGKGVLSIGIHDKLSSYMENADLIAQASHLMEEDAVGMYGEVTENLEPKQMGDLVMDGEIKGMSELK
ncbi:hypothetical protein RHGRI_006801 [Rhododendron griersonianum]|uniref:Pentatricopeptide repeat-containing protein n=1 Tax=Rhododendron griersonianum TaxID=479676 RepID=A0AAV6KUI1_9ERIC|nr:hypothetical protein RHGRI_006801 [Rhododendron griersonianum]